MEYKFRGKRLDNGEWVFGYFTKNRPSPKTSEPPYTLQTAIDHEEKGVILTSLVDPATVGQYTGLKDKYRCEIYEGDILETFDQGQIRQLWYVRFEQGCFIAALDNLPNYIQPFVRVDFAQVEVIGNIHDNPDLLEVRP
jgi:uncharacterized phage protein (TIGR01671 family)